MRLSRVRPTWWVATLMAMPGLLAAPSMLSAQTRRHVEVALFASDVRTTPVYLRPAIPLVEDPPLPTQTGRAVLLPALGVAVDLYLHDRVDAIVQWSRTSNRSSDVSFALPFTGGFGSVLRIRPTEHVQRGVAGLGIDIVVRPRMRLWVGGGWQIDRSVAVQRDLTVSDFHGAIVATSILGFTHATGYPVLMAGAKAYPAKHILAFAEVAARVNSESPDSVYQTARVSPRLGLGVSF